MYINLWYNSRRASQKCVFLQISQNIDVSDKTKQLLEIINKTHQRNINFSLFTKKLYISFNYWASHVDGLIVLAMNST